MLYVYIVAAVALVPILDNFLPILKESYSWWLVPVLAIGFFLAFIILHCGILAIYIQCINMDKKPGNSSFLRGYINLTIPMFYRLAGVHVHTRGEEKIPCDCRVMLVCNHRSVIDPVIIMGHLTDLKIGFIGKKEVYEELRFVGKAMHKMNGIPLDRESTREAAKAIVTAVKFIKNDVTSIGVFPEGYTNKTEDNLLPLRSGVFKVAERAKCPIVVCTVINSPTIFTNMFRRRTDVYFDVAAVLFPEELEGMHTNAITEKVTEIMNKSIEESNSMLKSRKD